MGELAACRSFLEGAAELRVPVLGKTVYAFYEYGTDLGSSKLVKGNPTEYYRRAGRWGSNLCGSICKMGACVLKRHFPGHMRHRELPSSTPHCCAMV